MDEANSQSTSERKPLRVGQHQRTITARPVSVTCEQCHQTTTRLQYPGYPPRYCSEACKQVAHRERDRQRKAAQRAHTKIELSSGLSDPLAQLSDTPSDLAETLPAPPTISEAPPRRHFRLLKPSREELEAEIQELHRQYGEQLVFSEPVEALPHQWRSFGVLLESKAAEVADGPALPLDPPLPAQPIELISLGTNAAAAGDSDLVETISYQLATVQQDPAGEPAAELGNVDDEEEWDEDEWDEDEEDDIDDPLYQLQAVRLKPGQKRHLATDWRETLCGRELYGQQKELRGFDARDCQRCQERAIALYLCCYDCDKPLLHLEVAGRCKQCQARFERAEKKGTAGDVPAAEVLKERRSAAYDEAWEKANRRRDRKALEESDARWRRQHGFTTKKPGRRLDPLEWLDQRIAEERLADALDQLFLGSPSPLPTSVIAGREIRSGQIRYTFIESMLGYLGEVIVRPLAAGLLEYRANIAGHPDDPMSQQRSAILQPIATALQDRLIHAGPVFPKPGVLYQRLATAPAYYPPHEASAQLLLCCFCEQPILFLIHAEDTGTLEDYARDMFEIYREKNLPAFIAGPPMGEGPVETLPADLLQVWPERGQVRQVPTDEFRALLEALSLAHCKQTPP